MKPETAASVVRGKIRGKPLYCRIPIRRKRVPLFPDEFRDMLEVQRQEGLSDSEIKGMADALWKERDYEHAGILLSYLAFCEIMQRGPEPGKEYARETD